VSSAPLNSQPLDLDASRELLDRNAEVVPGGLASINRKAEPVIAFSRAQGSRMWDVAGKEYIDYHAGFAPYILGHNDPDQNAAVKEAMDEGRSNYGAGPTTDEGELARLFLDCLPLAEKVQFLNTGSEATAQAIRAARAATGRDHVILVQGSYNGNQNVVAFNVMTPPEALGSQVVGGEYPLVPISAGIPGAEQEQLHVVEFNDLEAIKHVVGKYDVAAMITEPVLQNVGVVKPRAGYLEGIRSLADEHGFLFIMDEVKTGFRSGRGGYQTISGVQPDLSTFGKAFASGFPIAALAGKTEYMDLVVSDDPKKRVLVAGTYNCHPVPVAAAIACLKKLSDPALDVYGRLEELAQALEQGQRELFSKHDVTATIVRQGSAHCVYFCDHAPVHWWDLTTSHDHDFDARYRRALIERGIYNFPLPTKQGSISFAHSDEDIALTLSALNDALPTLA
jgi:glutamate-1-semialdehyde 2,1-aminomutase